MISFSTVIENFNRVYEDRNSSEKHLFLNSDLDLIEDSSQKASFFDIVHALQSHKWESASEADTPEISKKIKKLWLQTKFIYDDEPFSIRSQSKLINLFDKSITEDIFLNPTKLEEYSQQVQNYCEILYLCKLIVHAEEKLESLSEKIGIPPNLEKYYQSLELKYEKVLAFQKTPEFQFLKNIQYTNPLLYLSVFIETEEGQINKTHPELLEFFELVERVPTHSKKKKPAKINFTPEQIRNRLITILKNPSKEVSQTSNKQLLPFIYSIPKDSKIQLEEYQKFIKNMAGSRKGVIKIMETTLKDLERASEGASKQDILAPETVTIATNTLETLKEEMLEKNSALPVFASLPLAKTQNFYTQSLKKFIEVFRKAHTPLKDKGNSTQSTITLGVNGDLAYKLTGTKSTFFKNRAKKFGQDYLKFVNIEIEIFKEHFPTLFDQPDYLSNKEKILQVKKEVEGASSIYSLLIKELSKIALATTSVQKNTYEISPEYREFLNLLIPHSTSLPSLEEFISLNLTHPIDDFFSEKEVKTLNQLITHFEDLQRKIFRKKMTAYCEEYIKLMSQPAPLKKPAMRSEESFVSPIETPSSSEGFSVESTQSLKDQESTPVEEKDTACIEKQAEVNTTESSLSTIPSLTGAIPKRTLSKTIPLQFLEKARVSTQNLHSLRHLQSVQIEKKLSKFHYHNRIKDWSLDVKKALENSAYKNLIKTKSNKEETVAFHSFPKIIDGLLGTNYCQEEESKDSNKDLIKTYRISGMIIMQNIQHEGYFEYAVNDTQHICFHRCFNPIKKSAATTTSSEDLNLTQQFSHENLNIQCNSDTQTIRIDDPSHKMKIYIFPPSTNS